jgi:arabinose-5-phosphate isomerase
MTQPVPHDEVARAAALIRDEAAALAATAQRLDERFSHAVDLIVACADAGGSVLVTGLGKSGLIGAKISATLASLGVASHPVHPSEAAHGDLGRFRAQDVVLALSFSGETHEVVNLAAILKQDGVAIISITNGRPSAAASSTTASSPDAASSSLERLATVALTLGVTREACAPDFAAPTSSTTATLALGDALAVAAARRRSFTDADFARRHPGGSLGGLLRPVVEALRFVAGRNLPLVSADLSVHDALAHASVAARRPGAMVLINPDTGQLAGIFTDGDLRRLVLRDPRELARPIREVMTTSPRTLRDDALVRDAVTLVREHRQDEIPVVDQHNRPVGVLDVQDLIAMRLVDG